MNIQLRFEHPKNGHDCDKRLAEWHLHIGGIYTLEKAEMGAWHTDIYLKEVPGIAFNSVLFCPVNPAPCGCVHHAKDRTPCEHDLGLVPVGKTIRDVTQGAYPLC
jgi:hypothetical protein